MLSPKRRPMHRANLPYPSACQREKGAGRPARHRNFPRAGDALKRQKTDSPVIALLNQHLPLKPMAGKDILSKHKTRSRQCWSKNVPKTGHRGVIVFY
jgi:hypothetical protein